MKKIIAVCLAAALLLTALCSCSSISEIFSFSATRKDAFSKDEGEKQEESVPAPPPAESSEPETLEPEPVPEDKPALSMSPDFLALEGLSTEPVTWGPGVHKDESGRSTACVGLQEQYGDRYGAYFIGPEDENTVTLTFDQGYENGFTASILDTLKEKEVQAVFFLTGHYVRSQPELVQRMIDEGHILGNHSDAHKTYCNDLTPEESLADALYMQQLLRDDFGYEMRLFRFPEGEFSEQSLALVEQMGYNGFFWSFAYADWDPNNQMTEEAAKEKIFSFLHPGEIMLLHSVGSTNNAILADVIDEIRDRGYTVGPFEAIK